MLTIDIVRPRMPSTATAAASYFLLVFGIDQRNTRQNVIVNHPRHTFTAAAATSAASTYFFISI
jgi:hypothetical protein